MAILYHDKLFNRWSGEPIELLYTNVFVLFFRIGHQLTDYRFPLRFETQSVNLAIWDIEEALEISKLSDSFVSVKLWNYFYILFLF